MNSSLRHLAWVFSLVVLPLFTRGAQPVTESAAGLLDVAGAGNSFAPVFSAIGQKLVFVTHAANLVTNRVSGDALQILVRNKTAGNTELVSVGLDGSGGDGNSFAPSISSNGRWIAFASEASNLVANDTNEAADVFVRDLITGVTKAVSLDHLGRFPVDTASSNNVPLSSSPLISADGRYLFFESRSGDLGFGLDTNHAVDVFRRDLWSNTTVLVSGRLGTAGDPEAANAETRLAGISADGRYVAMISRATDLAPGVTSSLGDVYVRDMASNTTTLVSAAIDPAQERAITADVSGDGGYVVFSVQTAEYRGALYWRNLQQGAPVLVAQGIEPEARVRMSPNGRFVAYEDGTNIFRFDAFLGDRELVNVGIDGNPPASGTARSPVMTPDGNGIVFVSDMPGLVTNSPSRFQVYARDMSVGVTRLVSLNTNGEPSGVSDEMSLGAVTFDFGFVAFDSVAPDLFPGGWQSGA